MKHLKTENHPEYSDFFYLQCVLQYSSMFTVHTKIIKRALLQSLPSLRIQTFIRLFMTLEHFSHLNIILHIIMQIVIILKCLVPDCASSCHPGVPHSLSLFNTQTQGCWQTLCNIVEVEEGRCSWH